MDKNICPETNIAKIACLSTDIFHFLYCLILKMIAMDTGYFLKMLNDAGLASLGLLMWNATGCIFCKKKHCGYSRARLDQTSLFGCRSNCVRGASFRMYKHQRKPWHVIAYTMKNGVHATVYRTIFRTHWHYSTL